VAHLNLTGKAQCTIVQYDHLVPSMRGPVRTFVAVLDLHLMWRTREHFKDAAIPHPLSCRL